MKRAVVISLALLVASLAACESFALEFDTAGGESWVFELLVSGRIERNECDEVRVESKAATVVATIVGERFFARVPLLSGENELRARCSVHGKTLRSVTERWTLARSDTPKAWIRLHIEEDRIVLDGGRSESAAGEPAPIVRYDWRAAPYNPAGLEFPDGRVLSTDSAIKTESIVLTTPKRDGEYFVSLAVFDALGRGDTSKAVFRVKNGAARVVDVETEHPAWVDSAVLYGAAPYEFTPQNFRGITERLDEIAQLGATAVWLSPVTQAAPDDFGYSVANQFRLREDFGGEREFKDLVATAHALGLKVLVDFVPNHFSQVHAYYLDSVRNGAHSPYYDWFDRDERGQVTQYFDWAHLKNLNFDNPHVRSHITAAAARFVRDFDIDGFRIDASWAVARRAPEFWPELRAELKRIDPDIVLIAEASAREPYHVANGFDAAYDWTESLGQWSWHDVFGEGDVVDLARLRAALTNEGRGFPADSLLLRFINNNDTGERFITRHGPQIARLAATLQFTLPGIPLIYNGDEVGAAFQPYDEGPPLDWNETPLTEHYRTLAKLRRTSVALQSRDMKLLATSADEQVLSYYRPGAGDAGVLVLLNFSQQPAQVQPRGDDARALFARFRFSTDVLTGQHVKLGRGIRMPARSELILRER